MKSLVTGGMGFIGSNLVDQLVDLGHEVIVVDNWSSDAHEILHLNEKAQNYSYDICNYRMTRRLYEGVDYVFHLAAEVSIPKSIENPLETFKTNINGTSIVLQCAREANVKRVIMSSTSAIYGENPSPNVETQTPDCLNPYSTSKLAAEELCKMYNRLYGLKTVIFRYFNVYGERQPGRGQYAPVIGIFLNQHKQKLPLTVVGDGHQKRDFVYVGDVCKANILAATKEVDVQYFGQIYNIGTGENISVKELAEQISENIEYLPPRIGEIEYSLADSTKFKTIFGWQPTINIKQWIQTQL